MVSEEVLEYYNNCKENSLKGRYILPGDIVRLLSNFSLDFEVRQLGVSVQNRPIHTVKIGSGSCKILLWSQMHGNESTTTKALFDLLNAFSDPEAPTIIRSILEDCTLAIIPMLNPDGSASWTRVNDNGVDLNRDAQSLSQPESRLLRSIFDTFKPDVCFNLHGQRSIYGFETTGTPSVLSFLAPAANESREITLSRKRAMSIISHINTFLLPYLSNRIGRYDDGFNLNCVGDTFQNLNVPTVLFEAGHFPEDYDRDQTRKYIFLSLVQALTVVTAEEPLPESAYFAIPEHQKCFCDVLIKNALLKEGGEAVSLHIMFKEILNQGTVKFEPYLDKITKDGIHFGHREIDANFQLIKVLGKENVVEGIDVKQLFIGENDTITL